MKIAQDDKTKKLDISRNDVCVLNFYIYKPCHCKTIQLLYFNISQIILEVAYTNQFVFELVLQAIQF